MADRPQTRRVGSDWLGREPRHPRRAARLMLTRFARVYGIDVSEAEKPLGGIRRLRRVLHPPVASRRAPDRRRSPGGIVSPADGIVVECGLATAGKADSSEGDAVRPRRAAE